MNTRTDIEAASKTKEELLKQKNCFHRLEYLDEPPFRYRCTICKKKLKIASGSYPPKQQEVPFIPEA